MLFPPWLGSLRFAFWSCHAFHIMSSCASHRIRVRLINPSIFPVVRFAIRRSYVSRHPLLHFFVSGIKHSRNGPRLDMWPRYSTGRPPIKFRLNRSSFGTPTVIRVTVKASCVLQPNTPSKQPNNPSKSLPCPPPFDHDRVAENRTPFGAS